MASLSLYYLVGLLILAGEVNIAMQRKLEGEDDMVGIMEEDELLGFFEVMGSFLEYPSSNWVKDHPQPCTDTPWPGVECEIADDDDQNRPIFHITKIHIEGNLVNYNPPCKSSADLSDSLLKLPYLKTLSVFNCFVTSPVFLSPTLFGSLSSLEHLCLKSNPSLHGEIPSSLSKVVSLKVLTLSENNLQGEIPCELGDMLLNLEQLDLSYNNLSGEIPKEIGGLKSLTILDLSWNGLEGKLPSSLGELQLLQKIDLGSNKLGGKIPQELGKLNRLVLLDLSHNLINGPVPEITLSGLKQLEYLLIDYNPLNCLIPLFDKTLKNLKSISLSGCGLTGPIVPNSFSSLKNLTALSLDNNNLTGSVPPNLGSLISLDQLNLSYNHLSGEVLLPEEFINRLGKRLDFRGNSGLCTSNELYKTIINNSIYLQTPPCSLGTNEEIGEKKTCPDDQGHPGDDCKGIQSSWFHHGKTSSSATWLDYPKLMSTTTNFFFFFVLFNLMSFLL